MNLDLHTNTLTTEQSLYLRMHAQNPVHWHAWDDEVLKKAQAEQKLIIISIGYAACHWCHVMEEESFSDNQVARMMNKWFVSVKVDREERPDVDQSFMDVAQLVTGQGGWPLNAIALPDGRPIYAGTYFPKDAWLALLGKLHELYIKEPQRLTQQAEAIAQGINQINELDSPEGESFSQTVLDNMWQYWSRTVDPVWGGGTQAPKFPMPAALHFLQFYAKSTNNKEARNALLKQLRRMARGGIFDHVGGGFARYSTDRYWHVPHFEKMLYDNGQLLSIYANAFKLSKDKMFKTTVEKTANFLITEMKHPKGGFYSALDADTEGEEGKFYVWTNDELKSLLGDDFEIAAKHFSCSAKGNWEEGKNVLWIKNDETELLKEYGLTAEQFSTMIENAEKKLFEYRKRRQQPAIDDKMVASWNALAITGLCDAYAITGNKKYWEAAEQTAALLKDTFISKGVLYRNYRHEGVLKTPGFIDDYAFTIQAFIKIYQHSFNESYLLQAYALAASALELFKKKDAFFYYSANGNSLLTRKVELHDNVIPSGNSAMAQNLSILGRYFNDKTFSSQAELMLKKISSRFVGGNEYFGNWAYVYQSACIPQTEITIVGQGAKKALLELQKHYLPNVLIGGFEEKTKIPLNNHKEVKGQLGIYVCIDRTCDKPVLTVSEAISLLKNKE